MANRIREIRLAQDRTLDDVAAKMDMEPQTLSRLERGKLELRERHIRDAARVLRVPVCEILEKPQERPVEPDQPPIVDLEDGLRILSGYDVRVSAGFGALAVEEAEIERWGIPARWMRRATGACVVVEVWGDSMEPMLFSGDKVVIDAGDTNPSPPGVFVLWDGGGTVIKQVERIMGTRDPVMLRIRSKNHDYEPYELPAEEVRIAGRVIGLMRRL
ncbi:XRE family transcriptional regulator [Marinibaculum pumilum]|uniref:XRE family transcriptional regulator n=1 Tax=Marinibaculum pumilum TaxID=1766165 RepID=A0ABV7KY98_9PROT